MLNLRVDDLEDYPVERYVPFHQPTLDLFLGQIALLHPIGVSTWSPLIQGEPSGHCPCESNILHNY